MPIDLTPEQREAALANAGMPIHVHDSVSRKVFVLIEQGVEPTLEQEYIRHGLEVAREQIERGELADGGMESVIAEAKRRHSSNT